ncbi:hypothetical protein [Xenorhabdus sp. BG5]|uniref:hypothetical protein n=1 Tax=Xenorhabdus sp. BG5 TaxID=2782014 RepID=UPI00187F008F|nr:hypothetical protein [Xenorhabdus sp. BG5]MBE8597926.1 hypothetical protein [Xenorhabdus sp. BG5]
MTKLFFSVICIFSLSFNVFAKEIALTQEEVQAIEMEVKNKLKDPDSAKFKHNNLIVKDGKSGNLYCGLVNAKNSYGGYTGYFPFKVYLFLNKYGKKAALIIGDIDSKSTSEEVTIKMCNEHGYFL